MRYQPNLYEINTRLWLSRLSQKAGKPLTLDSVPDEEWQQLAERGFDLVWLMGVWRRSPAARQLALGEVGLRREYDRVLPGWTEADVAGSPYAVFDYSLDPALGKPEELVRLKAKLNQWGIGLVLDFVPNHLAVDHPWIIPYPGRFVRGTREDKLAHPDWYFSPAADIYVAHGRDPYFPPWSDTAQVNIFSTATRRALTNELLRLSEIADGVRCDMAMLLTNDIFEQVWGAIIRGQPRPDSEFWPGAIGQVKQKHPSFLFIAEVYWSLERDLQRLGFDFTYDKNLYDRLRYAGPAEVRKQLAETSQYQARMVRFIENHDEVRAMEAFGKEKSFAAAAIVTTLPGLHLFSQGQLEGHHLHVPIQLARDVNEPTDVEVLAFYERLLRAASHPVFHEGQWQIADGQLGPDGESSSLLVWFWWWRNEYRVVLVNYTALNYHGRLRLPVDGGVVQDFSILDMLTGNELKTQFELGGNEIQLTFKPFQAFLLGFTVK